MFIFENSPYIFYFLLLPEFKKKEKPRQIKPRLLNMESKRSLRVKDAKAKVLRVRQLTCVKW
jgi:hypothetical protein